MREILLDILMFAFTAIFIIWFVGEFDVRKWLKNKMRNTTRVLATLVVVIPTSCGSATYKFRRIDIEDQMFYGQDRAVPFSECRKRYDPKTGKLLDGGPCVMIFTEDYQRLKEDAKAVKQQLIDLQRRCK